jgi:hypothetical protein
MTRFKTGCLVSALMLSVFLVAGAALAHHSVAAYDMEKTVTVEGEVKTVTWTNPHISFAIETAPKSGQPGDNWVLEASSPGVLVRSGWTKKSLQPGDHASFVIAPLRSGQFGGVLLKAILPDGRTLSYSLTPSEQ